MNAAEIARYTSGVLLAREAYRVHRARLDRLCRDCETPIHDHHARCDSCRGKHNRRTKP